MVASLDSKYTSTNTPEQTTTNIDQHTSATSTNNNKSIETNNTSGVTTDSTKTKQPTEAPHTSQQWLRAPRTAAQQIKLTMVNNGPPVSKPTSDDDESQDTHDDSPTHATTVNNSAQQTVTKHQNDDINAPPSWPLPEPKLITAIEAALAWKPAHRTRPIFALELTTTASEINTKILSENDFDLSRLIAGDPLSPIHLGSDFRPTSVLEPLFEGHPLWKDFEASLSKGATFPLDDITEEDRINDLHASIAYGNHKSAKLEGTRVLNLLEKEVQKGWQIPITLQTLFQLPDVVLSPLGCVSQTSIDESGKPIEKWRLTHDQSFDHGNKTNSVNGRVIKAQLPTCVYGRALDRIIHKIVATRITRPTTPIFISKFDFKSAYRRLQMDATACLQSCSSIQGLARDTNTADIALISLRLPFGGSPCPTRWSGISEPITDLAMAINRCQAWDPDKLSSCYDHLLGKPRREPDHVPFATGRKMLVNPEADEHGGADVFLDDILSCSAADNDNDALRLSKAILLAMDLVGRPNTDQEPIPRDPLLSIEKAMAEGTPCENLIVLGWELDTRRLLVTLTAAKCRTWSRDIRQILNQRKGHRRVNHQTMDTIVGRLEHVAMIVKPARHFLSRLRFARDRAQREPRRHVNLTEGEASDFELWIKFLQKARAGISMNLLVEREPDHYLRTDACEHGLGGFNLATGRAWQWEIPEHLRNRASINFLEFLACVIGILLTVHEGSNVAPSDVFMSLTDNTSAMGWLRKSNFLTNSDGQARPTYDQTAHYTLARELAATLLKHDIGLHSQWFAGIDNVIADYLSRMFDMSNSQLTHYLLSTYPDKVPSSLAVAPLPSEIISLATRMLRLHPSPTPSSSPPQTQPTEHGNDTAHSSTKSVSWMIPSCDSSTEHSSTKSSCASLNPSATALIPHRIEEIQNWLKARSQRTSAAWLRPSKPTENVIPALTLTARLHTFYNAYNEVIET